MVVKFIASTYGTWFVMVGKGGDAITYATDWRNAGTIMRLKGRRRRVYGYAVNIAGREVVHVMRQGGEPAASALRRARSVAEQLAVSSEGAA